MRDTSEATRRSVEGNVERWTSVNTEYGDGNAARQWASETISWGQFGVTDASIGSPLGDVAGLDGLLIISPEFNHSVPGVLKNTLDWLSRPAYRSPLRDLPVTLVGFSPGPAGGTRGLAQLRGVLSGTASAVLPWPDLAIGGVASAFEGGALTDDVVTRRMADQLDAFADWIEAVARYRAMRGTHH